MHTEATFDHIAATTLLVLKRPVLVLDATRRIRRVVFHLNLELEAASLALHFAGIIFVRPCRLMFVFALRAVDRIHVVTYQ